MGGKAVTIGKFRAHEPVAGRDQDGDLLDAENLERVLEARSYERVRRRTDREFTRRLYDPGLVSEESLHFSQMTVRGVPEEGSELLARAKSITGDDPSTVVV
jgi:hypothetical protein